MKILLVNPPYPPKVDFLLPGDRYQPLGLAYLASYLKKNDFNVQIFDGKKLKRIKKDDIIFS